MHATEYFRAMARNNAWANHRLLAACNGLSQAEFEAGRSGFFPSIRHTLNHTLTVDWYYVDALEGGRLGATAWAAEIPCPTMAALSREQSAVDRRLIALCDGLTETRLAVPVTLDRGDRDQVERADRVLLHLFQHQIHHRGQAHAMLSATPVAPPQLDEYVLADEAPLRVRDLAALGLSEDDVWPDG